LKITIELGKPGAERRIRIPRWVPLAAAGLGVAAFVYAGTVTKPHEFAAGTAIIAGDVNENFDTLYTLVNGNIDSSNIANATIVGADIAADAIGLSKLKDNTSRRIATAVGTVNGTTGSLIGKAPRGAWGVNQVNATTYDITLPTGTTYVHDGTFIVQAQEVASGFPAIASANGTDLPLVTPTGNADFYFVVYSIP
jgi:hypothetical protein